MKWLIEPNIIEPNDACPIYVCWDRDEPCGDKNSCIVKLCALRYCYENS